VLLLEKDNGVNTKHGRRRWSITRNNIVLCKKKLVILSDFKSITKFQSNPNQITRFPNPILVLQIKSLCVIQS